MPFNEPTSVCCCNLCCPDVGSSAAEDSFSWTGHYKGFFVCDHVEAGVASNYGRIFELHIVQYGNALHIGTGTAAQAAGGKETSLYHGLVMRSPRETSKAASSKAASPATPTRS